MNKNPILSICIPTFNRAGCLDQILCNMASLCQDNCIQIYVSDNASSDNTEVIVRKYMEKYDIVHYHRHVKNIGPDDNFEYVLKMPSTRYRWLMSDTSYIECIDSVIEDLTAEELDGYILNGGDGTRHLLLPKQKKVYDNSIDLMKDIGWHLTWISCMIYNERLINEMDFERYRASCFNQTALMFDPTANRKSRIYFNPNLTVQNLILTKESGWLYHVFDVMYKKWYLLVMSLPLYYPYDVKMKCIRDNAKKAGVLSMFFHIKRRSEGKWSVKDVIRNRFFIKQCDGGYYFLLFLGICPKFILYVFAKTFSSLAAFLKTNRYTETVIRRIYSSFVKLTH